MASVWENRIEIWATTGICGKIPLTILFLTRSPIWPDVILGRLNMGTLQKDMIWDIGLDVDWHRV